MTPQERAHIDALAQALRATIAFDAENTGGTTGPRASVGERAVHLAPDSGYFTALHELGHVATSDPFNHTMSVLFGLTDTVLAEEARAWTWALDNAARQPNEGEKAHIAAALSSYLYKNRNNPLPQSEDLRRIVNYLGPNVDLASAMQDDYARPWIGVAIPAWERAVSTFLAT